jgi:hypothetical protein
MVDGEGDCDKDSQGCEYHYDMGHQRVHRTGRRGQEPGRSAGHEDEARDEKRQFPVHEDNQGTWRNFRENTPTLGRKTPMPYSCGLFL